MASVFAVCRDLADGPCDQTIRNALDESLPEISELQRRLSLCLVTKLPKALLSQSRRIAIDLTLIPYHGQPHNDKKEIYRTRFGIETSYRQMNEACIKTCTRDPALRLMKRRSL